MLANNDDKAPEAPGNTHDSRIEDDAHLLMRKATSLINALETQVRLMSRAAGDVYPVFHDDRVVKVALPYAAFDGMQMQLATRHIYPEPVLLRMIADLIPELGEGKSLVDVGSYSGTLGLLLQGILKPAQTHFIEPQKVVHDALGKTLELAGGCEAGLFLHHAVVGEAGQRMGMAANRPERLSETCFIRKDSGPLEATAIDAMALGEVKLMVLDYPGQKIDAIRGALSTIRTMRPAVCLDMSGRDMPEIREIIEAFDYTLTYVGKNHALFLPN